MRSTDCLISTAADYESLWRENEPDLPWNEINSMLVFIISNFPEVIAIANDPKIASKITPAIDFRSAPTEINFGKVLGIINSGLIYIKARCPDFVAPTNEIEKSQSYLLEWPMRD